MVVGTGTNKALKLKKIISLVTDDTSQQITDIYGICVLSFCVSSCQLEAESSSIGAVSPQSKVQTNTIIMLLSKVS